MGLFGRICVDILATIRAGPSFLAQTAQDSILEPAAGPGVQPRPAGRGEVHDGSDAAAELPGQAGMVTVLVYASTTTPSGARECWAGRFYCAGGGCTCVDGRSSGRRRPANSTERAVQRFRKICLELKLRTLAKRRGRRGKP